MVLLKKDIEDASTASKTRPLDLLTCHIVTMRVLMMIMMVLTMTVGVMMLMIEIVLDSLCTRLSRSSSEDDDDQWSLSWQ